MTCFSKLKKLSLSVSLFLLVLLFGSVILNVNNQVFALDDLSITIDSQHLQNVSLCSFSDALTWCGRKYLIITSNLNSFDITFSYNFSGSSSTRSNNIRVYSSNFIIISPPQSSSSFVNLVFTSNTFLSDGQYFYITATDDLSSFIDLGFTPPSGNINLTENGTYDVTNYATATVNVENEIIYGDYHDDLVSINNSILICAAVCLVLYFFYAIYRMIIKSTGGN